MPDSEFGHRVKLVISGLYGPEEFALQQTSLEFFGIGFHPQHPKSQLAALP